ncbi:MAG: O-Antigen ligase [Crocinitomicaceae bacterium]|jgi:hypothetical protein|nr:O-Antigen ligase [Crocinitomicaceae bacterium]
MMIQKTADQLYNSKLSRFLLLAWLLTLPFGAWLLPLSLGSFTIYPHFILTLLISALSLVTFRRWELFNWIYFGFCCLWFGVALLVARQTGFGSFTVFDLRSLLMQTGFFLVLTNAYYLFPPDQLRVYLAKGFHWYFGLLLAVGLFECFTGIHIQGTFTDKLLDLEVGNIFYMPVFIYDNPNDYLCYCLFFYVLCTALSAEYYAKRPGLKTGLLLLIYFFAFLGDGNFAKLLIFLLLGCELFPLLKKAFKHVRAKSVIFFGTGLVLLAIVFARASWFTGPKFGDSYKYRLNGMKVLEKEGDAYKLTEAKKIFKGEEREKLMKELDRQQRENPENSVNVRKNLILNGLAFIKEKPLLGIGPGNYQERHLQHKAPHFTSTVTSAHNFPLEIISQFGIFGWVYFGFLLWFFIRFVKRFLREKSAVNFSYLLIFVMLPFLWMMPSAYLYLDLNWLLVPMLFILYSTQKTGTDVNE